MRRNRTVIIAGILFVCMFTGSVFSFRAVQPARGSSATLEDILYVPSGKTLKKLSLGYSGLLADIYWTRAVQYFGSRHLARASRYDLLDPLLEITTDLDPHLLVAFQTGSIFLSQRPPEGAGQPDKAVALLEKGIRENPDAWRLYFSLGFVHYQDRHDYKAAEEAFRKGSELPGALPWMKVMAARLAENAEDLGTALTLWQAVYDNNQDPNLREGALQHIRSLQAGMAIKELEGRVQLYRRQTGVFPSHWSEMIQKGFLPGVPVDPTRKPFKLMPDGTVQVEDPSQFRFLDQY